MYEYKAVITNVVDGDTFDMDMEHLSSFLQNYSITHNQLFTNIYYYIRMWFHKFFYVFI